MFMAKHGVQFAVVSNVLDALM